MRRALAVLLLAVVAMSCSARTSTPDERAQVIEGQVWSPYCPGRLLIDCTAGQSRALRTEILRRVEHGSSEHAVLTWIRGEFGDEAIAQPSASGAGLVIWLFPVLVFAAGAVVVVRVVRKGRRSNAATPSA